MEMTLEQRKALALAQARVRAQQAAAAVEPEAQIDPTAGMSRTERVLANIGAGMADLGTGVRSLYTDMFGSDAEKRAMEQEIAEKRELDRRLAESTTGGSALQIAGGVIPTLAIPGAPIALNSGRLATIGAGAAAGAGYGALVPRGEGESRGTNMAFSGTVGAALPLALSAAKGTVNQFRGTPRAAQEVADAVAAEAPKGQRQAVLRQTLEQLRAAPGAGQAASRATVNNDIPLSVAARLGNPDLARLEAGSRARSGANWYDFDQDQARAVSDAVRRATSPAEELAARRQLRSSNRATNYDQAMSSVNEGAFARNVQGLRDNLEVAMRTPESSDPAVRSMLEALRGEIDRLGPDLRPEHLATIRANLSSKAPLVPQNAYQGAPRSSPATMSVLREVDNILNDVTGNRWQSVVSGYARDSDAVRASQAAGKVREAFWDDMGQVKKRADAKGDVPLITESGLRAAMNATAGPQKTTQLSPEAYNQLNSIVNALRAQGIVQGVKRSATAGGGSNTASDTIAANAARAAGDVALDAVGGPAATVGRGVLTGARNAVNARKDAALAKALQDENELRKLLEYQLQREPGLNFDQSETLRVLRALSGK